ncbi:succinylglutamate desuccinylase/aspartoacylase family protein [uncultured Microscilla sp.]|uniref:succinylglutamate desuccinylase/aspartoacylase family protein n=1 Tax=uncultured Microscilla sp. TaxID=432653 RepID=UPI002628B2CA|nr:succinylglutamate desuccinylase/aspartoacylase family protein [uncultured Microscilla sp.]
MSDKPFVILGKEVKKGERAFLELDVAKLHTRSSLKISIIVERAKQDGPTLLLMGGVHGDEVNGVAIVRDIIRKKYNKPMKGTVICIPVLNVFGYLNQTREFPDGRDLNRVFPGSSSGSLASQFAHRFTKDIAPLVDYVIDFHAGGSARENFPNVRGDLGNEKMFELAKVFGAPFILHSRCIAKSLRETLTKMGKTVILYEGGKSKHLDQFIISHGVNGALNIMTYLGMRDDAPTSSAHPVIIKKSKWIRAPFSGMFQPLVANGSKVTKKTLLGRITDPYGEFEKKVFAPFDCHIFNINMAAIVNKGDALFHVSVEIFE